MQDWVSIIVAVAAGSWLAWSLSRRFFAPPCQPPAAGPAGSDGFISIDALITGSAQKSGRPKGRPD